MRAAVLALLLAGCGAGGPAKPVPAASPGTAAGGANVSGPLEARGEEIFRREQCGRCHTLFDTHAEGVAAPPAPRLPGPLDSRVGPDLGLEGHRRSDDWHAAHLYAPEVLVPGSRMPSSRHLFLPGGALPPRPNDDGRALVAWLQGLGRGRRDIHAEFRSVEPAIPAPGPEPRPRRVERGRTLYAAWCVPCHGEAGDGRGPAAALLSPPPRDLARGQFRFRSVPPGDVGEDADLFRILTLGTGTGAAMPSFAFLDPEERWSLVLVVRDLAPATRGADLRYAGAPPDPRRAAPMALPATSGSGSAASAAQAAGGRLYAAWGCAACHGAAGEGKVFVDRREPIEGDPVVWASNLTHACSRRAGGSVAEFERALRFGVGAGMPSYAAVLEGEPEAARDLLAWLEAGGAVSPAAGSDRP